MKNIKRVLFIESTASFGELQPFLKPSDSVEKSVKRGDLIHCYHRYPDLKQVVMVDGVFEQQPSITHKEILWLIAQGVSVTGIASMGALRAFELRHHGMIGYGWVYQQYFQGHMDGDDEVAVSYDPLCPSESKTLAMVNLRKTYQVMQWPQEELLALREIDFRHRHWHRLGNVLSSTQINQIQSHYIDIKKQDVLDYLAKEHPVSKQHRCQPFSTNLFFNRFKAKRLHASKLAYIKQSLLTHMTTQSERIRSQNDPDILAIKRFLQLPDSDFPNILVKLRRYEHNKKSLKKFTDDIMDELGLTDVEAVFAYLHDLQIPGVRAYRLFVNLAKLHDYFVCHEQ